MANNEKEFQEAKPSNAQLSRNERVVSNTTDNEWVSIGIDGSTYFVLSLFDFDSVR